MKRQTGAAAILLIHCKDQRGIVAAVTRFIAERSGNVLHLDQHVDGQKGIFFMRVEWELNGFALSRESVGDTFDSEVGKRFEMHWDLHFTDDIPRMAVFVSRLSHCLFDILARAQSGEWRVGIPVIVSNHEELAPVAKSFGIPFEVFDSSTGSKEEREAGQMDLMRRHSIDFIVLARYMQILSSGFVQEYTHRIINIHHSFLPAFPGARPYHSAYARGVKIIGASSHYVTAELDAGPIIEQDVARVSHLDRVADMVRKGRDLEKIVLSRAVYAHYRRKVLVYDNRTVVFN